MALAMVPRVLFLFACALETQPVAADPAPAVAMDGTPDVALSQNEWTFETRNGQGSLAGPKTVDLGPGVLQNVAFSPSLLAFSRTSDSPLADLFVVDLATGAISQLTNWPGYEDRPVFSPDGTRLAFFSGRTGLAALYVSNVSLDVSRGAPLNPSANVSNVSFSEPVQLTNVGLEKHRRIGGPPEGYLPPPDDGVVIWTDAIRWTSRGEIIEVRP